MNTATTKDSISLTIPRSVILNCLEQEHLLDEIEKKMAEDREEYDRNIRNLGVGTEHAGEYVEGHLFESDHIGNPYREPLDRIATALEALCGLLIDMSGARGRGMRSEARSEAEGRSASEGSSDSGSTQGIPTEWRCGYTIEEFPHPIDNSILLYQVHRDGRTLVFNADDYEKISVLDDVHFTAAMDEKFGLSEAPSEPMVDLTQDSRGIQMTSDETVIDPENNTVTRTVTFEE